LRGTEDFKLKSLLFASLKVLLFEPEVSEPNGLFQRENKYKAFRNLL